MRSNPAIRLTAVLLTGLTLTSCATTTKWLPVNPAVTGAPMPTSKPIAVNGYVTVDGVHHDLSASMYVEGDSLRFVRSHPRRWHLSDGAGGEVTLAKSDVLFIEPRSPGHEAAGVLMFVGVVGLAVMLSGVLWIGAYCIYGI